MADASLTVKVGADVGDLEKKLAIAQENLRQLNGTMKSFSQQALEMGTSASASFTGRFHEAAQATAAARKEVSTLKTALADAAPVLANTAMNVHTMGREFVALGDEFARGNYSRMAGSFSILATTGMGMSYAMWGAVAGVAALTAGLGYLAYQAIKADNAFKLLAVQAHFAGNMDATARSVRGLADRLQTLAGASQDDAITVVHAFATMQNASAPLMEGLTADVGDYALMVGLKLPKAAEILAKSFSDPLKEGEKFVETLHGVTNAEVENVQIAIRMGDANKTAAAMLDALNTSLGKVRAGIAHVQGGMFDSVGNFITDLGLAQEGLDPKVALVNEKLKQQAAAMKMAADAAKRLRELAPTGQQDFEAALAAEQAVNPERERRAKLLADIAALKTEIAQAKREGDQVNLERFTEDLKDANRELDAMNHKISAVHSQVQRWREQLTAEKVNGPTLDRQTQASVDLTYWRSKLSQTAAGSSERMQVEQTILSLERQIAEEQKQAQERQKRADEAHLRDIQQAQRIKAEDAARLQNEILGYRMRQVQERARSAQISPGAALSQETAIATQGYVAERGAVGAQLSNAQTLAQKQRLYDQLEALDVRYHQQIASIEQRYAAQGGANGTLFGGLFGKVTPKSLAASIFDPIGQGFDHMVVGMLRGTMTFQMAWRRMAQDMVLSYINSTIQVVIHHIAMETAKTIATATGIQARKVMEAAAHAEAMAMEIAHALKWIAMEAGKVFAAVTAFLAPDIGPMAPAAGAAVAAATIGGAQAIAFAAKGFDVPDDTFAYLHKREMVLPAPLADAVRGMAGGRGGGAPSANISINAMDSSDVMRTLTRNSGAVGAALRRHVRDFGHL